MDCCAWCAISGISAGLSNVMGMGSSRGLCSTSWRHSRRGWERPFTSSLRQRRWSLIGAKLRYYQPIPPPAEEIAIKHAIDSIYTAQPSYGSRRIAVILERDHQLVVNRKAVQRHMRQMGIVGISPG